MALTRLRFLSALVVVILSVPLRSPAYETPLSDTAVREAYFLGQRRDETMGRILDKYTVYLAAPKSGPHIASVTMFTPYAQAILHSRDRASGYSAQQAALDHAKHAETVKAVGTKPEDITAYWNKLKGWQGVYSSLTYSPEQHNGLPDSEVVMCQANSLRDGAFNIAPGYGS